ncbi:DUF2264 domain-containing protein [Nesterenkonia sp. CL21]|uniref:DUF2264 domain-containing protein n=1 Tax=Nesterenkonia sp. CL21 TaxID=3064894 RepID=UPI002878BA74|nr:DUF2264 domain-containing protein [Nesterenkonia sp. CL21]MDS2172718.1 DUF2264 domain-containing protein [Nesterenkonia sp. CL21]
MPPGHQHIVRPGDILPGSRIPFPEEDRETSPYTGYTRAHWEAMADHLVGSAWQWASPGGAHLNLPGPASGSGVRSDGLEGFARSFLAAAFRVRGADGADPHGWLDRYAEGLRAGTASAETPEAEPWLTIRDHDVQGQPMVESASIALCLRLTRPWLWDRLDEDVQDAVESWLRGAITSLPAANNWYLFPYSVAGFLESVGRGDELTAAARERALHLLEQWNLGQGWYTDGDGQSIDHYIGWALHLYPVLDDHLRGESGIHGSRLEEFLQEYRHLFGADGAPLFQGRSMTYRFAAVAAVALGAVTGDTPMPPGESKRLLNATLRHFLEHGALTEHGLLSLGWHGPHPATVQRYSGPASPLWAAKAFVGLLQPDDAPLWRSVEGRRPLDDHDVAFGMSATGWAVQATRDDGVVRIHNHGSDHLRPHQGEESGVEDPLYSRLAYSTATGPTPRGEVPDNHVAVRFRGRTSVRRRIHRIGAGGGGGWAWAASWHTPIFPQGAPAIPGLRVESWVVARGADEVRIDRIIGACFPLEVQHTGWAVQPGGHLRSTLQGLHGWHGEETLSSPAGTAFAEWCEIPALQASLSGSVTAGPAVLVSHARVTGRTADVAAGHAEGDTGSTGDADLRVDADVRATADAPVGVVDLTVTPEEVSFRWAGEPALITVRFEAAEVRRYDEGEGS